MTDFTRYEYAEFSGLPPDGERWQYIGYDADGNAFMLWWDSRRDSWVGCGRDPKHPDHLVAFAADDAEARIVRNAPLPARKLDIEEAA